MKQIFALFFLAFLLNTTTAQNGIVSVARYKESEPPVLDAYDGLPEFEGGMDAFKKAFKLEFTFPQSALDSDKGGEGMIGFMVDTLGNIHDVEVIESVSPEIDAEVVSIFSSMHQFKPMWKPMKLAVLYRAFPSIYKDEEHNKALEILIKSKKPAEWQPFFNKKRAFVLFAGNIGATVPTDALFRSLTPAFQLTGQLEIFKHRWGSGISGTIRSTRLKKEFEYDGILWEKDTALTLPSFTFYAAYRLVDEERLTFTPFAGFSVQSLILPAATDEENSPMINSFLPTIGATVDLKWKQKAMNDWGTLRLNTTLIRLRFAVNMANFKDGRRGNLVDLGVGLGWFTRELVVK
jgi:Gram-negative bacterial TonB protein C-terminal